MPQTNPGSLSDRDYIDIISYLLEANDFPAGKGELKSNSTDAIRKAKK
jgi:hypothetical protein